MLKKEDAAHVARLARLKLSDEELTECSQVLTTVLSHFEQIASVNTEGVEPLMTPSEIAMRLRPDIVEESVDSDRFLENTTERSGRLFRVPPVV